MRLAFVAPLPPAATGIADYTADVTSLLASSHQLDLFHAQEQVDRERLPAQARVFPAAELPTRHARAPYDLVIHQLGNGPAHDFMYSLLGRVPGLLVLHDLVLHHARARFFLDSAEVRAYTAAPWDAARRELAEQQIGLYREELACSHPAQAERLAAAQLGTIGRLLPYAYPLFRLPVMAARAVAVHNTFMAEAIRREVAGASVHLVPMPAERAQVPSEAVAALRARHGLGSDDFVVASFGLLTREKRIETVARATARAAAHLPSLRLLLVGPIPDSQALEGILERIGVRQRTIVAGRVSFAELPAYMELADLVIHLRYPTARETSAALLRVLAQGRPTVMSALEHWSDIPESAVLRADVCDEEGETARAILHLAARPERRAQLGRHAAELMRTAHSAERCRAAYESAIAAAATAPDPDLERLPRHWR